MTETVEEPIKKKRGRPKKIVDESEIKEEQPKKKRGRPKKPIMEFPDYILTEFKDYIDTYDHIIEYFIKSDEDRIDKDLWTLIYNHVKKLNTILYDYNTFWFNNNIDYTYKINSQWKTIDKYRESSRRRYIKDFYEQEDLDPIYKAYLIFSHFNQYIKESSREFKL